MKTYEYAHINSSSFYCTEPIITKTIYDIVKSSLMISVKEFKGQIYSFTFVSGNIDYREQLSFWIFKALLDRGWEPFASDIGLVHLRLEKTQEKDPGKLGIG